MDVCQRAALYVRFFFCESKRCRDSTLDRIGCGHMPLVAKFVGFLAQYLPDFCKNVLERRIITPRYRMQKVVALYFSVMEKGPSRPYTSYQPRQDARARIAVHEPYAGHSSHQAKHRQSKNYAYCVHNLSALYSYSLPHWSP